MQEIVHEGDCTCRRVYMQEIVHAGECTCVAKRSVSCMIYYVCYVHINTLWGFTRGVVKHITLFGGHAVEGYGRLLGTIRKQMKSAHTGNDCVNKRSRYILR